MGRLSAAPFTIGLWGLGPASTAAAGAEATGSFPRAAALGIGGLVMVMVVATAGASAGLRGWPTVDGATIPKLAKEPLS